MVTIWNANLAIVLIVTCVRKHHRRDTSRVGLEREYHQVTHHTHVVLVVPRNPIRNGIVDIDIQWFGWLGSNASFDFAYTCHVFVQLAIVIATKFRLQPLGVV